MYKLNEQIPMSMWEKIADAVQLLDISTASDQEFKDNLIKLKELLNKLDLCLEEFNRVPANTEQVGLATLLESIYSSDADIRRKKTRFYETIYSLSDLGVKSMEFKPISFCEGIYGFSQKRLENDKMFLAKFFTDGDFCIINIPVNDDEFYWIDRLDRANYVINMALSEKNGIVSVEEAQALLKNFNGLYPSKEEFLKMEHAKMMVPAQSIKFGDNVTNIYQSFEKGDVRDASFAKKLTQSPSGQYYYKK